MFDRRFKTAPMIFALIVAASCTKPLTHEESVLEWRADRKASLERPDGWLSLIGLYWLNEGDNPIGSDEQNTIVLPSAFASDRIGNVRLDKGVITISVSEGSGVILDGKPVKEVEMLADTTGDPTILTIGTLSFYVISRAEAFGIRVKDSASKARARFSGLDSYPIDEKWRTEATFVPHPNGTVIVDVPTFQGPVQHLESTGRLEFMLEGSSYSLDVFPEEEEFFVIYGDQTNGPETYGGGRFVYTSMPDENGMVDLDFNLGYSPPCVFTPFATCPLPPMQNRLALRIEAGEKNYTLGVGAEDFH